MRGQTIKNLVRDIMPVHAAAARPKAYALLEQTLDELEEQDIVDKELFVKQLAVMPFGLDN